MSGNAIFAQIAYSWPWYIVRASGLTGAVVLVLLIISGIGLKTGLTFRFFAPIKTWAVHKAIGLSLIITVLCHIVFLLFDNFMKYTLSTILMPSLDSIWLALGTLAFYLLIIIIVTSLTIIHTRKSIWKLIHFLSYITAIFIFFHALNMGTDLKSGFLRYIWIGLGLIVLVAMISRYLRSFTIKK